MARLDQQRATRRPMVRVSTKFYVRGYAVTPHSPWGGATAASEQPATGATAGTPGTWTPASSAVPTRANLIAGNPNTVAPNPATAWTVAQRVLCSDSSNPAFWNGTAWVAGQAP